MVVLRRGSSLGPARVPSNPLRTAIDRSVARAVAQGLVTLPFSADAFLPAQVPAFNAANQPITVPRAQLSFAQHSEAPVQLSPIDAEPGVFAKVVRTCPEALPNLRWDALRTVAGPSNSYNCVGDSIGSTSRWIDPEPYADPVAFYREERMVPLEEHDYRRANGFAKAAYFVLDPGEARELSRLNGLTPDVKRSLKEIADRGEPVFRHAMGQLPFQPSWGSKNGRAEKTAHATPEELAGGFFGEVAGVVVGVELTPQELSRR
jgi:hypothetical protein